MEKQMVVAIGASVRALAQSLLRAGYAVYTIDLFRDCDLAAAAPGVQLSFEDYPHGFLSLLGSAPPGPVIFTGGLENEPELLRQIRSQRQIWGTQPEQLVHLRDPFFWSRCLAEAGLPLLPVRREEPPSADRQNWIWKAWKSSGGLNVSRREKSGGSKSGYWQRYQPGGSYSMLWHWDRGQGVCIGISRLFSGSRWCGATGYAYAGNLGPVELPRGKDVLQQIAQVIQEAAPAEGFVGYDFQWDGQTPWLLEINPRYPASTEIYERAAGVSLFRDPQPVVTDCVVGKAIVYARAGDRTPGVWPELPPRRNLADIPPVGVTCPAGSPICTYLLQGEPGVAASSILRQLGREVANFRRLFSPGV